jgi:CTP:molybdopterin cytidylyltransferase MocA
VGVGVLSAVVLAAGESKRMNGRIKALLPIEGTTFIERITACLFRVPVDEVFVVLGAAHETVRERVCLGKAVVLINEDWGRGQLSSLRLGVQNLSPRSDGVLFTPVDHPFVRESTYEVLISVWKSHKERVVVPAYLGRKGHPALFPKRVYGALLRDELPNGARDILYRERGSVIFVPVDDPGVVLDVDTPEDYRRMTGEPP